MKRLHERKYNFDSYIIQSEPTLDIGDVGAFFGVQFFEERPFFCFQSLKRYYF